MRYDIKINLFSFGINFIIRNEKGKDQFFLSPVNSEKFGNEYIFKEASGRTIFTVKRSNSLFRVLPKDYLCEIFDGNDVVIKIIPTKIPIVRFLNFSEIEAEFFPTKEKLFIKKQPAGILKDRFIFCREGKQIASLLSPKGFLHGYCPVYIFDVIDNQVSDLIIAVATSLALICWQHSLP